MRARRELLVRGQLSRGPQLVASRPVSLRSGAVRPGAGALRRPDPRRSDSRVVLDLVDASALLWRLQSAGASTFGDAMATSWRMLGALCRVTASMPSTTPTP